MFGYVKRQDYDAALDAIQNYIVTFKNKDKKPGWCNRVAEAEVQLNKILRKARRKQKHEL